VETLIWIEVLKKKLVRELINSHHTHLFNDWINKWHLVEFKPSNRAFTWANNQDNLIIAALDKMFASTVSELFLFLLFKLYLGQ
jgi:hypothetical protein